MEYNDKFNIVWTTKDNINNKFITFGKELIPNESNMPELPISSFIQQNVFIKNLAEGVLHALHARYNGRCSAQQTPRQIAEHSMELLRLNIQDLFNKEVENIVKKYIDVSSLLRICLQNRSSKINVYFLQLYFKQAMKNVRENLGDTILDDNYVSDTWAFIEIDRVCKVLLLF